MNTFGLDGEALAYLAEIVGTCEGDLSKAAAALRNSIRTGKAHHRAPAIRAATVLLEEHELEANAARARQLREHLQRRDAIASDGDLDHLSGSYCNAGVTGSAYLRRQG